MPWLLAAIAFAVGAELVTGGRLALRVVGLVVWAIALLVVIVTIVR